MKKRLFICLLILTLLAGTAFAFSASGESLRRRSTVTIDKTEYDRLKRYEKLDEVLHYIQAYYYKDPDVDAMLDTAIQGLLAGLEDPYTFYYDEENWKSMWEDEEGEYTGIGIQLLGNYDDQSVKITRVFRDTPAQAVGMRKNDVLVRVEDIEVTTETMQAAVNTMRGEVGGTVQVEVLRGEEYITFDITRAAIHLNNVDYTMLENNVGYVVLYQFATDALINDFTKAMDSLEAEGARSIILDLRDNPGGWVDDAVNVADRFLDKKLVVYTNTRYEKHVDERYTKSGADDIPLVVLVNGNSASSSEILSGALKDYGRATIVGTQTFGKGIMQYVLGLSDNVTGMQLTYCEYFTPKGNSVHGIGITPDIIVEMPDEITYADLELGDMSDPQLEAAWNEAVRLAE
ncbi:MAG: S41 family peptidase [Clostridia bacterium]|nr:S41 family peptidase [Clostridia bacterium]